MSDALTELRRELAQITDLRTAARVLEWDQLVMMPRGGAVDARRPPRHGRATRPRALRPRRDRRADRDRRLAAGRRRPRVRRGMPRRRRPARLGEGAPRPARPAGGDDEARLGGGRSLGRRAGERRLRELPSVARPDARAEAALRRVLPRDRRPVRPAARRLRARHAHGRGASRVRPARAGAPRASRGNRPRGGRAVPHRSVPRVGPARPVGHRDARRSARPTSSSASTRPSTRSARRSRPRTSG